MRLRTNRVLAAFFLATASVTILSACAGAPPSIAGIIGGIGGGLGVLMLLIGLGATQTGCSTDGDLCLSPPPPCLTLRDAGPRDGGSFLPDVCLSILRDGGVDRDGGGPCLRDACLSIDGGPRDGGTEMDAGGLDAGPGDVAHLHGLPRLDYEAERNDVIAKLKDRGVLPTSFEDEEEEA